MKFKSITILLLAATSWARSRRPNRICYLSNWLQQESLLRATLQPGLHSASHCLRPLPPLWLAMQPLGHVWQLALQSRLD
ncbi:hypothetical protein EV424DRAFT_1422327, partial [Suillus variegatus]